MRYSSALVLSTIAIGQAAAANIRHASFHARRQVEEKRNGNYDNVDWTKVSYDLSGVDWNSVFHKTSSTPTPTPSPSRSKEVKVQAVPTTPAYTPAAAQTTEAAKPSSTNDASNSNLLDGVLDYLEGIGADFTSWYSKLNGGQAFKLDVLAPQQSDNKPLWLGDGSKWKTTFINDGSEDIILVCWTGSDNSFISKYTPNLAIKLASGQQQTISHADGASGACAPGYPSTKLGVSGALKQVWYEFTFKKQFGTFDLSRNPAMSAPVYTAKGSKCTSNANSCVFQCTKSSDFCQYDYDLVNCSAANGGGAGFDTGMGGVGGGCSMGDDSEHVTVTFN